VCASNPYTPMTSPLRPALEPYTLRRSYVAEQRAVIRCDDDGWVIVQRAVFRHVLTFPASSRSLIASLICFDAALRRTCGSRGRRGAQ
jgi:hypothetical protein